MLVRRSIFRPTAAPALGAALCAKAAEAAHSAAMLLAQQEQGGVSVRQGGGKNYVLEAVVVLALFGLALYTVCRSSRRV